jgi:hypothetical protein
MDRRNEGTTHAKVISWLLNALGPGSTEEQAKNYSASLRKRYPDELTEAKAQKVSIIVYSQRITTRYTTLCHTLLHYILCYTILYYAILYYTIIYCTVLYLTILRNTIHYTILYYTIIIHGPCSTLQSITRTMDYGGTNSQGGE